jgi:bifunctional UDP-N-acetylglucosamine pyrophosphorylase / glucosamine-1-phosphate N-acetyltransferase
MPVSASKSPLAIILAAGQGTRMKSDLPKVVHAVGGRAMVCTVVDACREAGCARIIVVVGYKQELVRAALTGYDVGFAVQSEQLGTGHAVRCCEAVLGADRQDPQLDTFVLCGDGPLIRAETLGTMLAHHRAAGAVATLATSLLDDPSGYGRIVRDARGRFLAIVEQKNASSDQLKIREINPSYYCFRTKDLFDALEEVQRNPLSGEYYVTDVPSILMAKGARVEVLTAVPPEDVLSINTPEDLEKVDSIYRARRQIGRSHAVGSIA